MELNISCECGKVQGVVRKDGYKYGVHFVCLCDDCQAYAHFLGKVTETLDQNGGTDVLPVFPARFQFTSGKENIQCVRLSEKGIYRWYAGCCKAPLANSLNAKMGYIGLIVRRITNKDREKILGPLAGRVMAKFGIPPLPPDASLGTPPKVVFEAIKGILRVNVFRLKRPTPFFEDSGRPIVKPYVLTPSEREDLRKLCGVPNAVK